MHLPIPHDLDLSSMKGVGSETLDQVVQCKCDLCFGCTGTIVREQLCLQDNLAEGG